MQSTLNTEQKSFELKRLPEIEGDQLQAWDASDEYLLDYVDENIAVENADKNKLNILVINDSFGALSIPLLAAGHKVSSWSDSELTRIAIAENATANAVDLANYRFIKSTDSPQPTSKSDAYDLVLMKLTKSHALLEEQLIQLAAFISAQSTFIASAMVKNLHSTTLNVFEKCIAKTTTSLAKKKARLIFVDLENKKEPIKSRFPLKYKLDGSDYEIINHANVFSREKLDIGTRFLLSEIPKDEKYKTVVDMACGNGVLGLIAAERNPQADIIMADESFMAVRSAAETFAASGLKNSVRYEVADCLSFLENKTVDLVLNNPPFHQQHAVGTGIALKMFTDAKRVLKFQGELYVVANRHLGYHVQLKKMFGNCMLIASNKKFVILKSYKNYN